MYSDTTMLRLGLGLNFLCFFLILLKRGACRDWFVSPSKGVDDENCGTESHPCRTYTYVIQYKWVDGGLSVLLECGLNNKYNECVPDRPYGQPGGIAVTFIDKKSSLLMSTWGHCSEYHAYIDCQKNGSAFWIQSPYTPYVVFRNIVFANGSTAHQGVKPYHGSAITVHGYVDLILENVTFYGNYNESHNVSTVNSKHSPVIYIEHEAQGSSSDGSISLILVGCIFQNNSNGVHVSSDSGVKAVVENSTFLDNVGHYLSSSLYFTTKTLLNLHIRQCHFESNWQLQNGSVINIKVDNWSNISMIDTNFINNQGVFLPDTSNTTYMYDILMGVVMININRSYVSAEHSNSSIHFERVNMSNNYFPHRGGGFDIRSYYGGSKTSMNIVMDNVHMENNTGFWRGGGVTIMSSTNTLVLVRDSNFIGNKALGEISYGGALYISGSRTVIESCKFVNNSASTGTTLFLDEDHGECEIKDSVLQSELPQNATSIVHALSGSFLRLSNSTVHATRGHASTLAVMTREPLVLGYRPKHYIELLHGSKIVCPVKYSSIRNTTMPFAHVNVFHCHMCPGTTYTLEAAQMSDYAVISRTYLECQECPGGGYCSNGDIHSRHNNWCYQEDFGTMKRFRCLSCKPNRCCGQYICDNPQLCSGNREGTACGQCKEGFSLAFRFFDAFKVTNRCYPNDLLRSSLGYLIFIIIIVPILTTLVYYGFYLFRCLEKKLKGKCLEVCKKYEHCRKQSKPSLFATLQNIVFFFYPTFFAYEVNDGIFNVVPHIPVEELKFTTFSPLILTRHDSEAAFQFLCLLFILPLLSLVIIFITLLCLYCDKCQQVKQSPTENANASSQDCVQTENGISGYTNVSFQGLDKTEEIPSGCTPKSSQRHDESAVPPDGHTNIGDQGCDEAAEPPSENTNASNQGRDEAGDTTSKNTNVSDQGRGRTAEHLSGNTRSDTSRYTNVSFQGFDKIDEIPSGSTHDSSQRQDETVEPPGEYTNTDVKGTFLYICVKHYFSVWYFFYGFITPTFVSVLVPTYAEKGLYREFTNGTISSTNDHLIGVSVWLIVFLGCYPFVVMYLSYNRCEKVCDRIDCCHRCPREKKCDRNDCCHRCPREKECKQELPVIRFSLCILPGLPTLPLGLMMLIMSCFSKCSCKLNCQCPSESLMACITTIFDDIAQEGRKDEQKNEENEEGQRKIIQHEENKTYEQKNNQNGCTRTCGFNTACLHGFLLSAWEGFQMLYVFIFTTVSKVTLNNQAVRIPILISLSGAHLFFVTWTRPFKYPYANIVYGLSSLALVIVGALNAIQVGDFGTGQPLAISEEVLIAADKAQLALLIFPLFMCVLLVVRSAYKSCKAKKNETEQTQPTICCLKGGMETSTESQAAV